jgi:hypothetical protein
VASRASMISGETCCSTLCLTIVSSASVLFPS